MRVLECYGGGTALGAVQVHTAERLNGVHGLPSAVHGVSVGGLTAAMRGAGKLDELRRLWSDEIKGSKDFQSINLPDIWRGLFNLNPLRRMIRRSVCPADLRVPTYVHLVDLGTKRYERVLLNDLDASDFEDALICGATQHGIHERASFQGRPKVDAGVRHVLPIPSQPWRDFDVAHVIACSPVTGPGKDNHVPPSEVGISRGLEILVDTVEASDYRRLRQWVERGLPTHLYEPQERPGDPFDASAETTRWRLEQVGRRMWQSGREIGPRPGLHLGPMDLAWLRRRLKRDGVDLDALLAEDRRPKP